MTNKRTDAERARASEARRRAAGGRTIKTILSPEATAALARLQTASGMNAAAAVSAALILADAVEAKRAAIADGEPLHTTQ